MNKNLCLRERNRDLIKKQSCWFRLSFTFVSEVGWGRKKHFHVFRAHTVTHLFGGRSFRCRAWCWTAWRTRAPCDARTCSARCRWDRRRDHALSPVRARCRQVCSPARGPRRRAARTPAGCRWRPARRCLPGLSRSVAARRRRLRTASAVHQSINQSFICLRKTRNEKHPFRANNERWLYRPNSTCSISCGFVVQQAVQQNPQQIYN